MVSTYIWRVVLAFICLSPMHVLSMELPWQANNRSLNDLTGEFQALYSGLRNLREQGYTITTREYSDTRGQVIGPILRSQGLFYGRNIPKELEFLTCELNPSVCTLTPSKKPGEELAKWKNKKGDVLNLPDITFIRDPVPQPYEKKPGDTMRRIVQDRGACAKFDDQCRTKLLNLNRNPAIFDPGYQGTVIVPTESYHTILRFRVATAAKDVKAQATLATKEAASVRPVEASEAKEKVMLRDLSAKASDAKEALPVADHAQLKTAPMAVEKPHVDRSLQRRIVEPLNVRLRAVPSSPSTPVIKRDRLFELIGYPAKLTTPYRVTIGLLDRPIDLDHCDFDKTFVRALPEIPHPLAGQITAPTTAKPQPAVAKPARAICGEELQVDPEPRTHHGTHIVGILNARQKALSGRGINPSATVVAQGYDPTILSGSYTQQATRAIVALVEQHGAAVLNISWDYPLSKAPGTVDHFGQRLVKGLQAGALIVVASGNEDREIKFDACDIYPACYGSAGHIISVVALNDSITRPDIYKDSKKASNYGVRFHIGAPGASIESALNDNRRGRMSGSSQAAPIVAGVASLFYTKARFIPQVDIKHRLIYTSDLFQTLEGKLLGGRINASRALAIDGPRVRLEKGSEEDVQDVALPASIGIKNSRSDNQAVCTYGYTTLPEKDGGTWILRQDLRRLTRNAWEADFVTVFFEQDVNGGRHLCRFKGRLLAGDANQEISITREENRVQAVKLAAIHDFVSPLRSHR